MGNQCNYQSQISFSYLYLKIYRRTTLTEHRLQNDGVAKSKRYLVIGLSATGSREMREGTHDTEPKLQRTGIFLHHQNKTGTNEWKKSEYEVNHLVLSRTMHHQPCMIVRQ